MKINNIGNKVLVIVMAFVLFCFGVAVDSFYGPFIKVNYLSEVETLEKSINNANSKEENSEILLKVLDKAQIKANDFDYMVDAFYNEFIYIEDKFESFDYVKYAESNALKGFLKDLKEQRLVLKYDILGGYIVTSDLNYITDKYSPIVTDEVKNYLEFRTYELNNHIYNINIENIDLDEVVKRIDILSEKIKARDFFYDTYKQLINYYYEVYEGKTHDFFIDSETYELKSYAKTVYKSYSNRKDKIGEISRDILENGPWQKQEYENNK